VIPRESAATRAPVSSGHNAADASGVVIAAGGDGSIAAAVEAVIADEDDLSGGLVVADTPADTTGDTRHSGGHN